MKKITKSENFLICSSHSHSHSRKQWKLWDFLLSALTPFRALIFRNQHSPNYHPKETIFQPFHIHLLQNSDPLTEPASLCVNSPPFSCSNYWVSFIFLVFLSYFLIWVVFLIQRRSATRMQADNEDYELKQMRDMAAAKKRWDALVWNWETKRQNCFFFFFK